jgi:AcrR family transcriptional regulator
MGPAGAKDEPAAQSLLRKPQQARSRRTLERMLAAALDLLRSDGPDALTVAAITRGARTSVGSFYARFEGKDDLLRYLGERSLGEALDTWGQLREAVPSGDLRSRVEPVVRGLLGAYLDGPVLPVLHLDGIQDPFPGRRFRLEDRIADDLTDILPGPASRTRLAARFVLAVLREAAVRDRDGESSPFGPRDLLVREMVELAVGYLGGKVRVPLPVEESPAGDAPPVRPAEVPSTPSAEGPSAPEHAAAEREDEDADPEDRRDIDPFEVWE